MCCVWLTRCVGRDDRWEDREYDFLNGGEGGLVFFFFFVGSVAFFFYFLACLLAFSAAVQRPRRLPDIHIASINNMARLPSDTDIMARLPSDIDICPAELHAAINCLASQPVTRLSRPVHSSIVVISTPNTYMYSALT